MLNLNKLKINYLVSFMVIWMNELFPTTSNYLKYRERVIDYNFNIS